jgi:hypothetical protein
VLRQRQADEEKNDFDYLEEHPDSDEVAPDDKGCESEDQTDDEPGSPEPVSNTKPYFQYPF